MTDCVNREEGVKFKTSNRKVPCMVYSRVVGYYRPTTTYNKGKELEWNTRSLINVNFEN